MVPESRQQRQPRQTQISSLEVNRNSEFSSERFNRRTNHESAAFGIISLVYDMLELQSDISAEYVV
jgi:hypothetical protein